MTVRKFEHDVFISYAHIDDERDPLDGRWVTDFVEDLTSALNSFGYFDELRIYRDTRNLEAGQKLEELRRKVQASAVFLGILSPNYVRRDWTIREFNCFQEVAGNSNRTILVQKMPFAKGAAYPAAMEDLYRPPFFHENKENGVIMSMSRKIEPLRLKYAEKIQHLASHVIERHKEAMAGGGGRQPPPADADAVVLLGRVTDDLHDDRELVRSHLRQHGIHVIPADDYPEGGAAFKERLAADLRILAAAPRRLFVQLVGPYHSKRPEGISMGYELYQLEAARQAGAPALHWRADSLDVTKIVDRPHADLLASATALSPERLKQEIVRRCEPPPPEDPRLKDKGKSDRRLVFVNSEQVDLPLANDIRLALEANNFGVVLPDFEDGDYDDLDIYIRICEALVVVFGDVPPKWVKRQLLHYVKLEHERDKNALVRIFDGPPAPKEYPGISLPNAKHVSEIDELIAHLNA